MEVSLIPPTSGQRTAVKGQVTLGTLEALCHQKKVW